MNERKIKNEVNNPTPERQILHQLNISNGRYSKRVLGVSQGSLEGETYGWIYFLEDTEFTSITDGTISPVADQGTAFVGVLFKSGQSIAGIFIDIVVDYGKAICYSNGLIDGDL